MPSSPPFRAVWSYALLAFIAIGAATPPPADAQAVQRPASPSRTDDPVAAAITEASRRFGVPETWIRSVMRVESAGDVAAVSRAGAIGLMQVMPGTYAELRSRYGLGADPFAIRDNVMAGTAYLREMFDRYGAPGFLAAYNAGPGRWEAHVSGRRALPVETVGYLARLSPMIGVDATVQPSVRSAAAVRSPFEAPIFVALHHISEDQSASASVEQVRRIVAANAAVVPSSGGLFVPRQSATEPLADTPPTNTTDPAQPPSRALGPLQPDTPAPAANPLFPTRSPNRR